MRAWPAAKYLTYCFWRSWILVVYTAPIWSYVANGTGSASCSFSMYAWSTVAFALVAALLALFHEKASLVLARKGVMCLAGVISSVGMLMEYAGAFLFFDGANLLFVSGALLTGVGTAFIAVRAGQIYAATRPVVAVTNTALSELASGLVFFFVVGTVPQIALLVAALLPLAAALMTLFESDADATRGLVRHRAADIDAATRRASVFAFARFLVVVFLLTFMANLSKGAFALQDAEASLASGTIGTCRWSFWVSLRVGAGEQLAQIVRFRRGVLPARAHARAGRGRWCSRRMRASMAAAAVIVLVYCLFSLFMWCLLTYLARSDYWSSIQVFGYGRSVFALGSLAGLVVGQGYPLAEMDGSESFIVGLVLAFLLVAASMLIFRESDVRKITSAGWLAVEAVAPKSSVSDGLDVVRDAVVADDSRDMFSEEVIAEMGSGVDADGFAADHNLTAREREVFELMLRGRDAKSIGEALVISDNTAKAHIRSIYAKTGVHTRQEFIDATEHVTALSR